MDKKMFASSANSPDHGTTAPPLHIDVQPTAQVAVPAESIQDASDQVETESAAAEPGDVDAHEPRRPLGKVKQPSHTSAYTLKGTAVRAPSLVEKRQATESTHQIVQDIEKVPTRLAEISEQDSSAQTHVADLPPASATQASQASQDNVSAADQPTTTTQVAPAMIPDVDETDEAYAESTTTSYVTSIASEISKGVVENGRVYPNYGQHSYGMPVDESELERHDLQHRKYQLVIGDKHFLAPIGPTPQRILDLGTGTGIWALDVADMYPSAQVIGVDIAPIQPKWVASNCQFEIDDVEQPWTFKKESFDFIHLRDPLYSIRDWDKLLHQIYDHLKPGGWCELACIYPFPMSDDNSMPADSGFKVICDKFCEASLLFGTPTDVPMKFADMLREHGFADVAQHLFKIPSAPWPKDKRLKQIGALEMMNVVEGATGFGLRVFQQFFGWTPAQTELAMVNFRRDVKNRNYHQYCFYVVAYGRKPLDLAAWDL